MNRKIIIGTRGSQLALWQAKYFQNLLSQHNVYSELKIILTAGDKNQKWQESFDKLEGKNFFTKEIEDALLKKEIDIAVHSFKDVEASFYDDTSNDLIIAGLSNRHAANDILILHPEFVDKTKKLSIKERAKIGTSSARRYAQLRSLRPDVEILPLRGNVPTRIEKLKNHLYDGIIIARAGVERLNISLNNFFVMPLPVHYFVPAAGQGIIAFQTRKEDTDLLHLIQKISNKNSEECSKIERTLLKKAGGGCSKPIGVLCEKYNHKFRVYVSYSRHKEDISIISITEQKEFENAINTAQASIQKIQDILHNSEIKNIFISKKLEEENYLKRVMKKLNWNIIDESLIETQKLNVNEIPHSDWVFFNSKNAVKYFFDVINTQKNFDIKTKKIGCISHSTAEYLEKYGISPHFVGQGNDVTEIGKKFSELCANQKVIFPCSESSLRSVESIVDSLAHTIHFPVYKTIEKPQTFSLTFDYVVFTSPSNVRAFFKTNNISSHTKIIAIGESTKKELLKHSIIQSNIILPVAFDEVAIAGSIFGNL